ncbi:MAG: Holliday junction branch migration protein RuvA [Candidatus Nephthysia bennettiae]|uniref:Holliday junction branch migration complex subunit RuvA n=1 Tax=Candidatus Nephthysia bennettiae TaxID=3127016 RepID=A0A934KC68_9BACT|nr:Holliday junction branch migration protein RuvA [Candidatus Dormibacteraeota bacterium]MBJ7611205.1 Holliday junction branch migration protein RuvA [Candidatus Dormibacteraeota bacterium]PZR85810.1 MAG: Holliday junction branch migration protein RuvA [Candidatus Dormibacteraeota bacterium]
MIGYLRGRLLRTTADGAVVEANGVGYLVSLGSAARQNLGPVGSPLELHVHTHVREDQLALFGFASPEELDLFERLIQVDGVGPKAGLAILSAASLEVLKRAILAEDVAPIRRAPGVGPRTAQKVIIDLKPKLEAEAAILALPRAQAVAGDGEGPRQVEAALRGLGFTAQQARQGLEAVDWTTQPAPQEALAIALRALGR